MCDVCSDSVLTIIASDAVSPSKGFFVQKRSTLAQRSTHGRAFLSATLGEDRFETRIHVVPLTETIPALNERCWALQEAIMPDRTIQITNSELLWRCRTETFWETGVHYKDSEIMYGNPLSTNAVRKGKWYRLWRKWMESYATRQLTYPPGSPSSSRRSCRLLPTTYGR